MLPRILTYTALLCTAVFLIAWAYQAPPAQPLGPPVPPKCPEAEPLRVAEVPPPPPKHYIYGPVIYVVPMKVTACSPMDPKDAAYYARNGYAGDAYGIAADLRFYPKETQMRIPGYMKSKWEDVDSSGGTVIRKVARRQGIEQIDVKFRTLKGVRTWGSRSLDVEIILPSGASEAQRARIASIATDSYPAWVKEVE